MMFMHALVTRFDSDNIDEWTTASRYWRGLPFEPNEGNAFLLEAVAAPGTTLLSGFRTDQYGLDFSYSMSKESRAIWHELLIESGVDWCSWPLSNEALIIASQEQIGWLRSELWSRLLHKIPVTAA